MRKKFALLLAATMLTTTVLSGCGGSGGDGTGTGAAAEAGNNLVVQIGPDPETMDPALNSAIDEIGRAHV